MKFLVASLALLAGVSAQQPQTGFVQQPLPQQPQQQFLPQQQQFLPQQPFAQAPIYTAPRPTVAAPVAYPSYYPTVAPTMPYYPFPQVAAPVIPPPPAGPQFPQYKRWDGKPCNLVDLTTGSRVKGVIRENDLNGDLSCDTGAGTEAINAAFAEPFEPTADACKVLKATDENAAACTAAEFLLEPGQAALDTFAARDLTKALCTKPRADAKAAKAPWTAAKLLAIAQAAVCDDTGIAK